MIPGDGVENFPLMGRAIFQNATKRRFFPEASHFPTYWFHSGSFPGRSLIDAATVNHL